MSSRKYEYFGILILMDCDYEPIGNNSSSRDVVNCIHTLQKVEIKDQILIIIQNIFRK